MTSLRSKRSGFVIVAHPDKKIAQETKARITSWLEEKGQLVIADESSAHMAEFAVALGGDGMAVRTSTDFSVCGVITIPINVGGDVGFITIGNLANWKKVLELIIKGKYVREERVGLEVVFRGESYGPFVNDVVLKHTSSMGTFRVRIDNHVVYRGLRADGMIVSAPTGSTGYNMSAGGPVVVPGLECILLTPLCPDQFGAKPVVMKQDSLIEVEIVGTKTSGGMCLIADGQSVGEIGVGESVIVREHKTRVLFAVLNRRDFFTALHKKKGLMR